MRRLLTFTIVLLFGAGSVAGAAPPSEHPRDFAIVSLSSPAAASYDGSIPGLAPTKPDRGRLDTSSPAFPAYLRNLEREHRAYRSFLTRNHPGVRIVSELNVVLNAIAIEMKGVSIDDLSRGPFVRSVQRSSIYRPVMNVSTDLIRATEVWGELGGQPSAGEGIKVAIIDTGIDSTSPFFDDAGYPGVAQIDSCPDQDLDPATPNTTNKIVVCRVYASGESGDGPALLFDHGTHVAGTVAGNAGTAGQVDGTDVVVSELSGVAPGALLGNYNVFPGFGAGQTAFGGSAFSHDIARALEDAVLDGMDVANMSLGGAVQGPHDALAEAANAAVDAGMVLAVSAGNSGPGEGTIGSPGNASKVITAGASTNPHFVGISVTAEGSTVGAAVGEFENFDPPISAPYTVTSPANGCTAISTDLTDQIALIDRGVCTFTTKIRNAQTAGAVGVLIVNSVAGDPVGMAHDGSDPFPEIPAAMLGKAEGNAIKPSGDATVDGTSAAEFITANADIIAGFSSRGPTPFDFAIKPDVTAPGVNVLSSVFGGQFAFFQGTSMAAPHVAGAAALLLDRFPGITPAEVKSRLVNSAARVVTDHVTGSSDPGLLTRGGGRIDLVEAFDAATTFDPVSVSFGRFVGNRPVDVSRTVAVAGAAVTSVSVTGLPPANLTIESSIEAGSLLLSLQASRQLPPGNYGGDVVVTTLDGQTYSLPWFIQIVNR